VRCRAVAPALLRLRRFGSGDCLFAARSGRSPSFVWPADVEGIDAIREPFEKQRKDLRMLEKRTHATPRTAGSADIKPGSIGARVA
jgi:hypothetical protein